MPSIVSPRASKDVVRNLELIKLDPIMPLPSRLAEHLSDFEDATPEESLEMLVDLSRELPSLSPKRAGLEAPPAECRVQECQTAVFLWVDVVDDRVELEASVHEQSPTVRGLVALLVTGLQGASPRDVLSLPDNIAELLGLQTTLGMTRSRGFKGIVAKIKRDVLAAVS